MSFMVDEINVSFVHTRWHVVFNKLGVLHLTTCPYTLLENDVTFEKTIEIVFFFFFVQFS